MNLLTYINPRDPWSGANIQLLYVQPLSNADQSLTSMHYDQWAKQEQSYPDPFSGKT